MTSPREAVPPSGAPNNASPLDLDGLRKLAEAATPGERKWSEIDEFMPGGDAYSLRLAHLDIEAHGDNTPGAASDREFISAFDRETTITLLQRLTDAEAENASLRERLEKAGGPNRREEMERASFADVFCGTCGKPASEHGLQASTYVRGTCVWTWLGVVRQQGPRAADAAQPRASEPSPASQSTEST